MKKTLTSLLMLGTAGIMSAGLISCRKDKNEQTVKEYDQEQIQNYIKANGLTMTRDLSGGDTTGMYYQILRQGKGAALDYPSDIFFVYSIKSLDGTYAVTDTVTNHAYNYVGHLTPPGLVLAIKNILKTNGTQARVLIPSRLAYGINGSGTGSGRLPGNESLDYYINIIDPSDQPKYDDLVIKNYMKAKGINSSDYTPLTVGNWTMYYRITQAGTGTAAVTDNSQVGIQYTGTLMNGTIFDQFNPSDTTYTTVDYQSVPKGWQQGFKKVTKGAKLTILLPSGLAYGKTPPSSFTDAVLPANSCVRYDFNIMSISN